jgi:hypothetical protein
MNASLKLFACSSTKGSKKPQQYDQSCALGFFVFETYSP